MGDAEIKAAQEMSVLANTKKSTSWAVKVWKDWSTHRRTVSPNDWPHDLFPVRVESIEFTTRCFLFDTYS